jgi:hypothetical protein
MIKYILFSFLFFTQLVMSAQTETADCCGTCTGSSNCTACKNCSGCRHCSKNGGSCGACNKSGLPQIIKDPLPPSHFPPPPTPPNYDVVEAPFLGKVRKDAKTSVATGRNYAFDGVSEFLGWLPTDGYMYKLGIGNSSPRTKDENYNIEIRETSVIRLKLEDDNDIHITICDWEDEYTPINILTVEISGLPDEMSNSFQELSSARKQFYNEFSFFVSRKSATYKTKSKSPKITLKGSLFFDHYHNRENENDEYTKMKHKTNTSFEIHPITKIKRID